MCHLNVVIFSLFGSIVGKNVIWQKIYIIITYMYKIIHKNIRGYIFGISGCLHVNTIISHRSYAHPQYICSCYITNIWTIGNKHVFQTVVRPTVLCFLVEEFSNFLTTFFFYFYLYSIYRETYLFIAQLIHLIFSNVMQNEYMDFGMIVWG